MRFLNPQMENQELTYEDVFLLPRYSEIESRMDVDLTPADKIGMTIPVVVANMTSVAGRRMAEVITRRGGLVILPQDYSLEKIEQIINYLHSRHLVFETPVVLHEDNSIQTALNLINKRSHGAIIVVDQENKPVGIFTEKDAMQKDRFTPLKEVMTKNLITLTDQATPQEVFEEITRRRVPIMPIIKANGELAGVLTAKGAMRSTIYKPAINSAGKLLTAAAIGISREVETQARKLLEIGIDILVLDAAHGHQRKMIEAIKTVRQLIGPNRPLVAGNVVSEEGVRDLIKAGANIIKVGVGPGAVCITRMQTGMGRPQFTAVSRCAQTARTLGAQVWADGGIRNARDVALSIAAGASCAFFGSWFVGTYESPGDLQYDESGQAYKENFGMASRRAVNSRNRNEDAFTQLKKEFFEEGISVSRMYLKKTEESVEEIIDKVTAGLRSACTYAGAHNLEQFHENAWLGVQTLSGYNEGKALEKNW